jgi:hypothetical protein
VAACIPRTKATKRVALSALMAWSGRALPGLADPHRALAGCRAIPARDVGGPLEENALAVGQPPDAQAISESDEHSALSPSISILPAETLTMSSNGSARELPGEHSSSRGLNLWQPQIGLVAHPLAKSLKSLGCQRWSHQRPSVGSCGPSKAAPFDRGDSSALVNLSAHTEGYSPRTEGQLSGLRDHQRQHQFGLEVNEASTL